MPRAKRPKKTSKDDDANRATFIDADFITIQKEKDFPDLKPQERAFSEDYCINGYNHREAAETAGLDPDRGIRLLRDPLIRAFIAFVQDKRFDASIVTKDFIDAKLDELYDMSVGHVEVAHVDAKTGRVFAARKFYGTLALDILREKSKMNGIIKPDGQEDDDAGSGTEIHFHVKEKKSNVRVTVGKAKT
jgi:hypothetical protein